MDLKYIHLCLKKDLANILEKKVLEKKPNEKDNFSSIIKKGRNGLYIKNKDIPTHRFFYDIEKIQKDNHALVLPNIGKKKTQWIGIRTVSDIFRLGFEKTTDITTLSAVCFDSEPHSIINLKNTKGDYIGSITFNPIELINPIAINIDYIVNVFMKMEKPYNIIPRKKVYLL